MDNWETQDGLEPIAIIGMAGRFPCANKNLRDGVESISLLSEQEEIEL